MRTGMSGHWLGSLLGEVELHFLARSLGVMLFCVRAAKLDGSAVLRQEGSPFTFLWKGIMSFSPKGAVVIRFLGHMSGGHFQIINCGSKRGIVRTNNTNQTNETKNKLAKIIHKHSSKVKKDVQTVKSMHGVQIATTRRYCANIRLVQEAFAELAEQGKDPLRLDTNGGEVLDTIMELLMQRCGPKSEEYEGLSARATGRALLASVAMWYRENGYHFSNQESCVVKGSCVEGPPWKAEQVLNFRSVLQKQQAKARSNPVRRAYQLTHDDIAGAMRAFVANQLGEALSTLYQPGKNPNVDWLTLQTTLMVVASFGSGCRGAEMVNIRLGELLFLSNTVDTTIGAVLYGTKSKTGARVIRRIVFPCWSETITISPSHAILMQLVLIHGVHLESHDCKLLAERPLFPSIVRNQPQIGQQMKSGAYSTAIKELFSSLGITDKATEHSPRRSGCGFRYYVLNEDATYIRDILGHANIQETFTYIGFNDKKNSYVSQGYSACNAGRIR